MKKIFAFCGALLCIGMFQSGARAADQIGVYVAPKFIYGYTVMDKLKANVKSGGASVGTSDDDHDDAFGGALAIGYDFDKKFNVPVRAELEYSIFSQTEAGVGAEVKRSGPNLGLSLDQKLDIQTLFFNIYYDIKTGTPITPYIGAGLGMAFVDAKSNISGNTTWGSALSLDTDRGTESNTNFAWNVGAGAAWAFTDNLSVDLGYRFASLGEVKSDTIDTTATVGPISISGDVSSKTENLYMHQVMLGLRYTF